MASCYLFFTVYCVNRHVIGIGVIPKSIIYWVCSQYFSTVRDGRDNVWLLSETWAPRLAPLLGAVVSLFVVVSSTCAPAIPLVVLSLSSDFGSSAFLCFVVIAYRACCWDIVLIGTKLLIWYWLDMRCDSLVNRPVISPSWRFHSWCPLYTSLLDLVCWLLFPTQVVPLLVRRNNHPNLMLVHHYWVDALGLWSRLGIFDYCFSGLVLDLDFLLETMRVINLVIGVDVQCLNCYNLFVGRIW